MKIVVAGGTGFIGESLVLRLIASGESVTLLTRSGKIPDVFKKRVAVQTWDGKTKGAWTQGIEGADVVINLSGEGIAEKRWSEKRKIMLRSSRLDSTRAIVQAIGLARVKPKVFVNASAVGFYGAVNEGEVDEQFPCGKGFLPQLCADWEAAAREAQAQGVRVVLPRIGIVLGADRGALRKLTLPFKLFVGGPLGSGKQWVPWIHVQDVVGLILFSVKNEALSGPVNACAPYPVRMNELCGTLGRVLGRPSWLRVPAFILRAFLGEMAEMLLGGQQVLPKKMLKAGFKFRYASLESALISILGSGGR